MNIAFINTGYTLTTNGGVYMQAIMWKNGLEKLGDKVTLVNSWQVENWKQFDAILFFGYAPGCRNLIKDISNINHNIIYAPIIDPKTPDFIYKFFCKYWGAQKYLGLSSRFHDMWLAHSYPKLWLVRSEEERHYTNYCLEIPYRHIAKIPLHYRIPTINNIPEKEDFCLHVSRLASKNKNVERLIAAAIKYKFQLKLAGYLNDKKEVTWLNNLISGHKNIEYLGEVSEEALLNLYKRAKVFALPSLQEGVGMVALEAAAYGCEIVLTNHGAPKEYYDGRAYLVNPKSIDDIGRGIIKVLHYGFSQPECKTYVDNNYSELACSTLLHNSISKAQERI